MIKKSLFAVCVLLLALSCGSSVNPQLKAKIDSYNTAGTDDFGKSGKFIRPMGLAVGQYVIMRNNNDGDISITKTSIVGKEQGGFILENYSLTGSSEGATQMLVTGMDKAARSGNAGDIDIIWIKVKDNEGNIQTFEGPMMTMVKSLYAKGIPSVTVNMQSAKIAQLVRVPAGAFSGTYEVKAEVTLLGRTYKSTSWYHTSVPINGMVKSVSEDGKTIQELVKFGTKGAVRSF
jgi:hypothetical protein